MPELEDVCQPDGDVLAIDGPHVEAVGKGGEDLQVLVHVQAVVDEGGHGRAQALRLAQHLSRQPSMRIGSYIGKSEKFGRSGAVVHKA